MVAARVQPLGFVIGRPSWARRRRGREYGAALSRRYRRFCRPLVRAPTSGEGCAVVFNITGEGRGVVSRITGEDVVGLATSRGRRDGDRIISVNDGDDGALFVFLLE